MKQTNPLLLEIKEKTKLLYKKNTTIKDVEVELLPLVVNEMGGANIIFCNKDSIKSLVQSQLNVWLNMNVAIIIKQESIRKLSNTPAPFKNKYKIINDASESLISSNQNIKTIFCESGAEQEARFSRKLKTCKVKGVSHETLTSFLAEGLYEKVKSVTKQGEFAERGAIVDFFDPTDTKPCRVSYFEKKPKTTWFDIETQTSVCESKKITVFAKNKHGKTTLKEKIKTKNYQRFFYRKKTLKSVRENVNNLVTLGWEKINKVPYKGNKNNNLSIYYIDNLGAFGFKKKQSIVLSKSFSKTKKTDVKNFDLSKIEVGDFVCHENHGIGLYRGMQEKNKSNEDVMVVEYKNKNHIYVNIKKINSLHFYSKAGSDCPLDDVSRPSVWKRRKSRSEINASMFVDEVVNNFSRRKGFRSPPVCYDLKYINSFVDSFQHTDTKDQFNAWGEILSDLKSTSLMDRLVCGDVGFGKTELAIRAAFFTVSTGKQVLVLAPTTLLANQLKTSFSSRLEPFGLFVGVVSRFNNKSSTNSTYSSFINKKIDVLIGTHKLLNNSIVNNVGLVVIDEEHRFGAKQKDLLKSKFLNSNFLLLSATPIPRSLYLGLNNIHKISILRTPPRLRKPIETEIVYYNEALIKEKIEYELLRGGQTYVIYNSTKGIASFANKFKPTINANIDYIHGKMAPKKIKTSMESFSNKTTSVLFTTSIIESGIDFANANTIIIINCQNFGLSQLYQLRGRVGRSEIQAFAYMTIPKNGDLSSNAIKRLQTIETNNSLGVGYNISKNDLEIRGPGSILGYKQSGNGLNFCGLEMYSKIIKNLVSLKLNIKEKSSVSIDLFTNSYISLDYIPNESDRLLYYRALSFCSTMQSFKKTIKDMKDIYGKMDPITLNFLLEAQFKILCNTGPVVSIKKTEKGLLVQFRNTKKINISLIEKYNNLNKFYISFDLIGPQKIILLNINIKKHQHVYYLKSFINYINEFY